MLKNSSTLAVSVPINLSFKLARMPLRRVPLSRDHQRLILQWARERRCWRAEWRNVVFSDESRFNMSYNDGRIRVRRYAGERNLRIYILQRHRGPTPSVMVWGAIGYNMTSRLLHIEGNLNSKSSAVEQVVACALVTQRAVFDLRSRQVSWVRFFRGFSSPVTQMSGSFRPPRSPNIIGPSLSSILIHYGHQ